MEKRISCNFCWTPYVMFSYKDLKLIIYFEVLRGRWMETAILKLSLCLQILEVKQKKTVTGWTSNLQPHGTDTQDHSMSHHEAEAPPLQLSLAFGGKGRYISCGSLMERKYRWCHCAVLSANGISIGIFCQVKLKQCKELQNKAHHEKKSPSCNHLCFLLI